MTRDKLTERSKLAQINFACFNLYRKIACVSLIPRSPSRQIPPEQVPTHRDGIHAEFDDPDYATAYSKLAMQHVIGKFLADHKLTVLHLLETPHTKKIIEKARDNKEISRFEIKKPRTTKKVEKEAAPVVQEKANVE